MRAPFLITCALVAMCWIDASAQPAERGPDAATFAALERALFDALHRKDADALDRLLASDYVLRGAPDVDRATWLQNAVTHCWGDRSDLDGLAARPAGDAAIVSFVLTMYADPVTCEDAVIRSLITDVWERRDGEWRLALRHAGPVGASGDLARQYEVVPLPPPRWEIRWELSLVATGGNAETQTIGTAGELRYRRPLWETLAKASFVRTEAQQIESARSLSVDLRQSRKVSDRLELFGLASFLQDRFAGIDPRLAATAGAAYALVAAPPHALKLDLGVGATRETRLGGEHIAFATADLVVRYGLTLSDTSAFTSESGGTADLETAENWRLVQTLSFTAGLTGVLSLKISYAVKHLNLPVPGFEKTDTLASAALVLTFARR